MSSPLLDPKFTILLSNVIVRMPMKSMYSLVLINPFYEAVKCVNFIHIYRYIKHWPKSRQLEAFVNFYHYLPAQGSGVWVTGRGMGIGGSEMSVLTDENQYKDMRSLIAGKVKLPEGEFSGSIATRWGNVFEPILNLYIETIMNIKIYETGSIPGTLKRRNGKPMQNYSPDGLAVVSKSTYRYMIDNTSQKYFSTNASEVSEFESLPNELILLFELSALFPLLKARDYHWVM